MILRVGSVDRGDSDRREWRTVEGSSAGPTEPSTPPPRAFPDGGWRTYAGSRPMPINIDGAFAAILHDLGFPPAAGKLLFIVGRVAGLTAEVYEEHTREKPMRIRIPVQYDGVPPLPARHD